MYFIYDTKTKVNRGFADTKEEAELLLKELSHKWYYRYLVIRQMNLEARLIRLKDDLDKKALRDPRTVKEYAIRNKWERVSNILKKRYNRYGDDTKYVVMQEDDGYPD